MLNFYWNINIKYYHTITKISKFMLPKWFLLSSHRFFIHNTLTGVLETLLIIQGISLLHLEDNLDPITAPHRLHFKLQTICHRTEGPRYPSPLVLSHTDRKFAIPSQGNSPLLTPGLLDWIRFRSCRPDVWPDALHLSPSICSLASSVARHLRHS
jgi:hypothetical protein